MINKENRMTEERDLKKHFEAILGREIHGDSGGGISLTETVGLAVNDEGTRTTRDIVLNGTSTKRCSFARRLDVGGVAVTGPDGSVRFMLRDFHCEPGQIFLPLFFVATPQSIRPVYLTSSRQLTEDRGDVLITVLAWDQTGIPAGTVVFDWRCLAEISSVIL
jgi:hypothetical protein